MTEKGKDYNYKKIKVCTSDSLGILLILYKELIKHLEYSVKFYNEKDFKSKIKGDKEIDYAQRIIEELSSTLDLEKGGEISKNLLSIYLYINNRLEYALIKKDCDVIKEVLKIVEKIEKSWQIVNEKNQKNINSTILTEKINIMT